MIEVPGAVAVCFDAPTVEMLETRALGLHPTLRALGPDLLAPAPDLALAFERLRHPARSGLTVGEALLDQGALAGLGNVYRSELLWEALVCPFTPLGRVDDGVLRRLVDTGARLLRANRDSPARTTTLDALGGAPGITGPRRAGERLNVYGRTGRPCRRCGTLIRSRAYGDLPRRVYWCPRCQPDPGTIAARA